MSQVHHLDVLARLFKDWAGSDATHIEHLPQAASQRRYVRFSANGQSAVGTFSPDVQELRTFLSFTKHFAERGAPVPQLYAEDAAAQCYLQEDLGNTSLLRKRQNSVDFPTDLYKAALSRLAAMQQRQAIGLDYSLCYPKADFDVKAMTWDLHYFKYSFAKPLLSEVLDHELEKDFDALLYHLGTAGNRFFMYRDFQARNIMIKDGEVRFIDYQGGRLGPLIYDAVSLIFHARAEVPPALRDELLEHYLDEAGYHPDRRAHVRRLALSFAALRNLQVLGAYGLRGLHGGKREFTETIPQTIQLLRGIIAHPEFLPEQRYLDALLQDLDAAYRPKAPDSGSSGILTVRVNSFSFKRGIPADPSYNGGGFVFDCRGIHNPGRYQDYLYLTGRDQAVQQFLEDNSMMPDFLAHAFRLVDATVADYQERKFGHLMVSFGCTGGQHRSVYAAEKLAAHLREKGGVEVILHHVEQEHKGWVNA